LSRRRLYRPRVLSLSRCPKDCSCSLKTIPCNDRPKAERPRRTEDIVLSQPSFVSTCSPVAPTVSGPISGGSTWACLGYKDPLWIISGAWMVSFGSLLSHCDISEYNSRQMYGGIETRSIRTHAKGRRRFKYNRVHVSSVRTQRMSYAYILRRRSLL